MAPDRLRPPARVLKHQPQEAFGCGVRRAVGDDAASAEQILEVAAFRAGVRNDPAGLKEYGFS